MTAQRIRKPTRRKPATNPVEAAAAGRQQWTAEQRLTASRIDAALIGLDADVAAVELAWGAAGLLAAVSPSMAGKWASAWSKLEAAIEANDPDEVERKAAVCRRGLAAMLAEAAEAGQQPPNTAAKHLTAARGTDVLLVETNDQAHALVKQRKANGQPAVMVLTLQEVVNLAEERLGSAIGLAAAAKSQFPGSTVGSEKRDEAEAINWQQGDRLPF